MRDASTAMEEAVHRHLTSEATTAAAEASTKGLAVAASSTAMQKSKFVLHQPDQPQVSTHSLVRKNVPSRPLSLPIFSSFPLLFDVAVQVLNPLEQPLVYLTPTAVQLVSVQLVPPVPAVRRRGRGKYRTESIKMATHNNRIFFGYRCGHCRASRSSSTWPLAHLDSRHSNNAKKGKLEVSLASSAKAECVSCLVFKNSAWKIESSLRFFLHRGANTRPFFFFLPNKPSRNGPPREGRIKGDHQRNLRIEKCLWLSPYYIMAPVAVFARVWILPPRKERKNLSDKKGMFSPPRGYFPSSFLFSLLPSTLLPRN